VFGSATAKTRRLPPTHKLWVPHGYQQRAVKFLLEHGSAALFLDPGLGKTSITLEAFRQLQDKGIAKTMLVVAPLRVCQLVWEQEAKEWTQFRHLKFALLHGKDKLKRLDSSADIFLINPEGIAWLSAQFWGKRMPFDTVTIDELTKFKNAQSVRHKALLPKVSKVMRVWGLTGTPIPNGYMDLFGQMKILDGGAALGQWFTHFRNKYFEKGYDGFSYTLRRGAAKGIEAAIEPYVLRMAAEDYLDMPKLIDVPHSVVMDAKSRKVYDRMKKETIVELSGDVIDAGNAAAVYSKLKQMGNGAVYSGDGFMEPRKVIHIHDAKIEAILELVDELQGTPLLVGYEFQHDLARLQKALGGKVPYIGSGVSGDQARLIEKRWNTGKIPVLLAHPASAGHGLNLQKGNACHLAWFSCTWDYELYDQFIRRIMRQGNDNTRIFNHVFIVENSIDIKTRDAISNKGIRQGAFFDALNAEIYRDGKTHGSADGPHSTEEEDIMVRKLSRRSSAKKSQVEDDQDYDDADEDNEEEEQPKKRRSRRAKKEDSARPSRSRRAKKEELEDDGEDDDMEDTEEEEPVAKRARRKFSKAVQDKLDDDDADDVADEDEQDDEPEEKPKKRRSKRSAAKEEAPQGASTTKTATSPSGDAVEVSEAAIVAALTEKDITAGEVATLVHALVALRGLTDG